MHEPANLKAAPWGHARDGWLDALRAAAIASVVLYHVIQMSPGVKHGWAIVRHGHLGVDLFFILSGWLIGGLYWRERTSTGQVALLRFWQRRWWRTLPPYLAALLLSWCAVFVARNERFDWGYLSFLQNYYERIPFFLVSWSLCIEEHFYIFVPLAVSLAFRAKVPVHVLFAILIALPLVFRGLVAEQGHDAPFGFYQTATHLRVDGLIAGFWASALTVAGGPRARDIQRAARWALPATAAFTFWTVELASDRARYVWLPASVGISFLALLLAGVGRFSTTKRSWPLHAVAVAAYSLYLTHALAIHVARIAAARVGESYATGAYYACAALLIPLAGFAFYRLVEKPSINLRERLAPKRTKRYSASSTTA